MIRKMLTWAAAFAVLTVGCARADATANLLVNSDFSDYTLNTDPDHGGSFTFGFLTPQGKVNNVLTGWQTIGYNFVMTPGSATSTGALGNFGTLMLYGPGNGVNNGFADAPGGVNYIAADAAYVDPHGTLPIYQVLNNLTIGQKYSLTFDYAAAQQAGYDGSTTESWLVSFGDTGIAGTDETYQTAILSTPDHGFVGWRSANFIFTATGTTQTLSFLAAGTPVGQPPFSLLANPTLQSVPEPATWAMMLIGFGTVGVAMRRRKDKLPTRRNLRPQAI